MYGAINSKFNTLIKKITKNEIKDASILTINLSDILRYRVILKSAKEISRTQYSILGDLKLQVEQYQKFKYEPILKRIETIIGQYNSHSTVQSDNRTTSFVSSIQNLSISSKESIVNAEKFNTFSRYIHVKRDIEDDLLYECTELSKKESGLILLVGSVGDGKSHLLAYLKDKYPEIFKDIKVHNDATESDSPSQTATQTLESLLKNVYETNEKMIIAINIGMLHNFYSYLQEVNNLPMFRDFIDESKILNTLVESQTTFTSNSFENHSIVSFLDEQKLEIVDGNIKNSFYSELIYKIFSEHPENPIYNSFMKDDGPNRNESAYINYSFLLNSKVQDSIIYILNLIQVQDKRILTARSVLNFIYDIIVPTEVDRNSHSTLLPFLLFENKDKSKILESISLHDPSQSTINEFEELNVQIYNTEDLFKLCKNLFKEDYALVESTVLYLSNLNNHQKKYSTITRLYFLLNYKEFITESYKKYLKILENKDKKFLKSFAKNLNTAIYSWNGSPREYYLFKKPWNTNDNIRLAIEFVCRIKAIRPHRNSIFISIFNENESSHRAYELEVDYPLFILIEKISSGYIIKNKDRHDAINFNEFIENIIEDTKSMKSTIIKSNTSNRLFMVSSGMWSPEIKELN